MRALAIVLICLGAVGLVGAIVVVTSAREDGVAVSSGGGPRVPAEPACPGGRPPPPRTHRVDAEAAWALLVHQVKLGPRPAGSPTSWRLADELRRQLPGGRFQPVPRRSSADPRMRNVVGVVPGRDPRRVVVVGAHYDTKDIPRFVGANDGAGGTAALMGIARSIRPRELRPTVVFILFDGEESPRGTSDALFEEAGLRGSKAAAPDYRHAAAMVLLDFVADKDLSIPREQNSTPWLWQTLRASAHDVGVGCAFPPGTEDAISDDHLPFLQEGVPSIDLIDWTFDCWHKPCDNLSAVSKPSLAASSEAVRELLARL